MKAMIFAAGLGTRLRPLTNDRPKALVEVGGMTMLEMVIRRLKHYGFDEIVVNVHHFADKVEAFLVENSNFGIRIAVSDERALLLDTGGGLKRAGFFFEEGEPFLVHNTDILTDLDLGALYRSHVDSGALATLAIRDRSTSRYLLWDESLKLCGWTNIKSGEVKMARKTEAPLTRLAFSGIQVIDPGIFPLMQNEEVFSIIHTYLALAGSHEIRGYRHDETLWMDLGKIPQLEEAEKVFFSVPPFDEN